MGELGRLERHERDSWEELNITSPLRFHAPEIALGLSRRLELRRPSRALERRILWHVAELDFACELAARNTLPISHLDRDVDLTDLRRYRVRAAAITIPRLLPFDERERTVLRSGPTNEAFAQWGESVTEQDPELAANWHEWFWGDERQGNHSVEVQVACHDIVNGLGT